jgi:hypothetical protein
VPLPAAWDQTQELISRQKESQDHGVRGALKRRYVRWATPFGLDAVRRIFELASERGTKVAFIYLPARYNLTEHNSFENAAFYRSLGPILSVPEDIAEKDRYWYDWAHLNQNGAERLVPDLVEDIAHLGVEQSRTEAGGLHFDVRSGASATSNDAQLKPAKGS